TYALRALAARGPLPAVTVFFTPLEEVDCESYRPAMEAAMKSSAAVLDFEPAWPGGAVKTRRKGSGSVTIRAHGKAAHAGADFNKGHNAILELAHGCLEAAALSDAERGVTVNVGVIRGGIRSNVVPELAEAEVDFRVRTLEDGRRVEAGLCGPRCRDRRGNGGALCALRPGDPGAPLQVGGGLHSPPLERSAGVARVYEEARAVAAE